MSELFVFWNVVLEKDGKIRWTDNVRNEEVLLRVKEQMNIQHDIIKQKANWIIIFCVETAFYNGLLKER